MREGEREGGRDRERERMISWSRTRISLGTFFTLTSMMLVVLQADIILFPFYS